MMQSWRKAFLASLCCFFLAMPVFAQAQGEGDVATGAQKFYNCMGCHGIPGYSNAYPTFHVPRLGGQHAAYIEAALKAYRSGARKHPTMQAQASSLSDGDIQDIAAYLSQQKPQ